MYFGKINFGIRDYLCSFADKKRIRADIIFKRKNYSKLKKWKETSKGKTALLLEGTRRIGKSTIVEEFAQKEYRSYLISMGKLPNSYEKVTDFLFLSFFGTLDICNPIAKDSTYLCICKQTELKSC